MYSAFDIANYFLTKSAKDNSPVTNLKLQKLVYMANGLYQAVTKTPLISEKVEASPYGPVINGLYYRYRDNGNKTIVPTRENFIQDSMFDEDALTALKYIWSFAKNISAIRLSNWSHLEGSPWKRAIDEDIRFIPDTYIQEYFEQFVNKEQE